MCLSFFNQPITLFRFTSRYKNFSTFSKSFALF